MQVSAANARSLPQHPSLQQQQQRPFTSSGGHHHQHNDEDDEIFDFSARYAEAADDFQPTTLFSMPVSNGVGENSSSIGSGGDVYYHRHHLRGAGGGGGDKKPSDESHLLNEDTLKTFCTEGICVSLCWTE